MNPDQPNPDAERMVDVPLDRLVAHPANSNVMPDEAFTKLKRHLEQHVRYPPLIVRPFDDPPGSFQLLDGHHRAAVLRELGRTEARCLVWDADDEQALLALATLNRLRGRDDPRKRAALLSELSQRFEPKQLMPLLPEGPEKLKRLLAMDRRPCAPRPPKRMEDMPVAVHFFLLPAQKQTLDAALRKLGGTREAALLTMAERVGERSEVQSPA